MRRVAVIVAFAAALAGCGSSAPRLTASVSSHPRRLTVATERRSERSIRTAQLSGVYYAVTLRWSGVSIAGGTGFYIYRDGAQVADVSSVPYTFTGLVCGSSFALGVAAHDSATPTPHASSTVTATVSTPACPASGMVPIMGFDVATDLAGSSAPWADLGQDNLFSLQTTNGTALDATSQGVSGVDVAAWVAAVHAHRRLALITIGGIADQNWQNACVGANRSGFAANVANYMRTNGFDGIDLDIEDNAWAAMTAPVAAWDGCVQAVASVVHATTTTAGRTPVVSEDITTPWMGAYVTNDVPYVDQFNLMTYGDDITQIGSDVAASAADGIPNSKMVIGIDPIDYGEPAGGCGQYATYAQGHGLAGVMVWDINTDGTHGTAGSYPCLDQLAAVTPPG